MLYSSLLTLGTTGISTSPFWKASDFWIATLIGIAGLTYSVLAYREAKAAKRAAVVAGRFVKLQTITIELTEIAQKLDRIRPEILFSEARDLLTEISRRLRRVMSPFAKDKDLADSIASTRDALLHAQESLTSVRPADPEKEGETPNAVYFAIEGEFATVNNCVADLLGLFEMKSLDIGDDNDADG